MTKMAILNNLDTCTGCFTCPIACQVARELKDDEWWMTVKCNGAPNSTFYDDPAGNWSDPSTLKMDWVPVHYPKCDLCVNEQHVLEGHDPYCIYNCPTRSKTFGDLDDPNSKISVKMAELSDRGYKITQLPDAGTGSHAAIYYAEK